MALRSEMQYLAAAVNLFLPICLNTAGAKRRQQKELLRRNGQQTFLKCESNHFEATTCNVHTWSIEKLKQILSAFVDFFHSQEVFAEMSRLVTPSRLNETGPP